jgi:hypothetical protein
LVAQRCAGGAIAVGYLQRIDDDPLSRVHRADGLKDATSVI